VAECKAAVQATAIIQAVVQGDGDCTLAIYRARVSDMHVNSTNQIVAYSTRREGTV
jgi:hypothetical protein